MANDWSSADIHLHTNVSDGLAAPRDVLDWVCARTSLKVIAITDHNTVDGAHEVAAIAGDYPVEVIVGQEVDSSEGHIIGLWAPERIEPGADAQDTVDAIHAQGGIAIVAHPFAPRWWAKHGLCRGNRCVYDTVDFDGFEISNSTPLLFTANLHARVYMAGNRHRFAVTGGSDAHILPAIGASRTLFRGSTAAELRHAIESRTTRVRSPLFWLARNLRYASHLPRLIERERQAEAELAAEIAARQTDSATDVS
ncbi:MAG: CehA/McbA family metallohydrolase [Coriobacteriia bacterium]